jgi:hypothetical protein
MAGAGNLNQDAKIIILHTTSYTFHTALSAPDPKGILTGGGTPRRADRHPPHSDLRVSRPNGRLCAVHLCQSLRRYVNWRRKLSSFFFFPLASLSLFFFFFLPFSLCFLCHSPQLDCITRMLRRFVIVFPVFLFIMGEGKDIWMSSVLKSTSFSGTLLCQSLLTVGPRESKDAISPLFTLLAFRAYP